MDREAWQPEDAGEDASRGHGGHGLDVWQQRLDGARRRHGRHCHWFHIFSLSQHAFTKTLDLPYSALSILQAKTSTQLAMIARSATKPAELVLYDIQTEKVTVLKKASHSELSSEYISKPTIISFPSSPDPGSKDTPTACKSC
jgi:hypothetical protein